MAVLKIHYDGWVKLPAALLRALGAKTGDMVEAEPRDGGVVLRADKAAISGPAAADPLPAEDLRDKPLTPRRRRAASGPPSSVALPTALRAAGRRTPAKPAT